MAAKARVVLTPSSIMEAKYWHLLINHFNNELQEVKGKVDGFVEIS